MSDVLDTAGAALEKRGFTVHRDLLGIRPGLICHHPDKGIVAVDTTPEDPSSAMVGLNRKLEVLREEIPAIRRLPIERRVLVLSATTSAPKALSITDAAAGEWVTRLRDRPLEGQVQADIVAAYSPTLEVKLPSRESMHDIGSKTRATFRLRLDAEQEQAVLFDSDGVVTVTGPPGSGKTLVLAARAKRLALAQPNWTIQVLCYNNMLIPYLRSLVGPFPNIDVTTFAKFAARLGHRVALNDERAAALDVARARPSLRVNPRIDALMVDEAQDFLPAWIDFAVSSVRPGRGGSVLAGDPKQSLYRHDSGLRPAEAGRSEAATHVCLQRPYRSTRPILEVTSALSPSSKVEHAHDAFDGEPVDLVWAHSPEQQAAAVARDIADLIRSGERKPQNIGVLVTRKWSIGRVASELEAARVPVHRLYANQSDELDLAEPTVKIMTVHSAKGLDFDVVFLVGLEDLPDDESHESVVHGRVGYVGATRAKDQLVITYSKDNAYLERIRRLPEDTLRRWIWPDDFPGA